MSSWLDLFLHIVFLPVFSLPLAKENPSTWIMDSSSLWQAQSHNPFFLAHSLWHSNALTLPLRQDSHLPPKPPIISVLFQLFREIVHQACFRVLAFNFLFKPQDSCLTEAALMKATGGNKGLGFLDFPAAFGRVHASSRSNCFYVISFVVSFSDFSFSTRHVNPLIPLGLCLCILVLGAFLWSLGFKYCKHILTTDCTSQILICYWTTHWDAHLPAWLSSHNYVTILSPWT